MWEIDLEQFRERQMGRQRDRDRERLIDDALCCELPFPTPPAYLLP